MTNLFVIKTISDFNLDMNNAEPYSSFHFLENSFYVCRILGGVAHIYANAGRSLIRTNTDNLIAANGMFMKCEDITVSEHCDENEGTDYSFTDAYKRSKQETPSGCQLLSAQANAHKCRVYRDFWKHETDAYTLESPTGKSIKIWGHKKALVEFLNAPANRYFLEKLWLARNMEWTEIWLTISEMKAWQTINAA